MVIVRLTDGLGNQLFQYALGLRLAVQARTRLRLDVSYYRDDSTRAFRLDRLRTSAGLASSSQSSRTDRPSWLSVLRWRLDGSRPYEKRYFRIERHFHFDPAAAHPRRHLYLTGYWQSERYFSPVADRLRAEVVPRYAPNAANAALLEHIAGVDAVSVHVRRGDYVDLPHIMPLCSTEYYRAAVAAVRARVAHPHFFVFSDEPERAREQLDWLSPVTIVAHNGAPGDVDDLHLMSRCRHHIIANSTFSWWGAWLNPSPTKVVVAPQRWFADGITHSIADLLPATWLRIAG